MLAIAIGRFAEQEIRARRRFRVFQYRLIVAPHVAGEDDQRLLAVFGDRQLEPRRAEDVSRIVRQNGKLRADLEASVARNFAELL